MHRRAFLANGLIAALLPSRDSGPRLAEAARSQLGVTTGYDPAYTRIPYPKGDVPRSTGVCADVVIRAGRDGLGLDLQRLVHEDMQRNFAAYPRTWGLHAPDTNIDHRRVLNLEVFWQRTGAQLWAAREKTDGDAFPGPLQPGDLLTWLLDGRLPHIGVVVSNGLFGPRLVHNIGGGAQEIALVQMRSQHAKGHFRWPAS